MSSQMQHSRGQGSQVGHNQGLQSSQDIFMEREKRKAAAESKRGEKERGAVKGRSILQKNKLEAWERKRKKRLKEEAVMAEESIATEATNLDRRRKTESQQTETAHFLQQDTRGCVTPGVRVPSGSCGAEDALTCLPHSCYQVMKVKKSSSQQASPGIRVLHT